MNAGYQNLRGHQTWCVEWDNNGEPLVMLHGGLSATEDWDFAVLPAVEDSFHVYAYDRTAHGRTGMRPGFYHFDFQRDEAIAFLEDVVKGPAHLVGWSDGGIIALMVAIKRPDLVRSIIAIGTNYHYDSGLPFSEVPETITISEEDRAEFRDRSPDKPEMQEVIIRKAFEVWRSEPTMTPADLSRINCPVLVMTGDDEPFTNTHTVELYEALPHGRLAIVPGASHYLPKEKPEIFQLLIRDFYKNLDFPITKWPRLRAARTKEILDQSSSNS